VIDHLHPQRLAYNEVEWCTIKLKLIFEKVCKNSIFSLRTGEPVEYDIDYYRSLIDGGYVKDNDLWVFWMKTDSYLPFEDIENLHKVCKELNLDESKVVFINCDLNLDKNYDEWFKESEFDKKINCFGFSWYLLSDKENLIKNIGYNPYKFVKYQDREVLPSKKFINLNGNINKPREYILDRLEKFKNFGYISDLNKGISLDSFLTKEKILKNIKDGNEAFTEKKQPAPSTDLLNYFHKDSYFSIVQESGGGWEAFDQDKISAHFSEKITKPLYYGHPFILIGWKNSLKFLKEMGFKTYDDIFDESYDELETWEERTKAVWKEIKRVLTLPDEKFYKKFNKVQETVIYNQKRFFAYDGYVDDFITKLMKIYEKTNIPI
jgi:hypothetical protein